MKQFEYFIEGCGIGGVRGADRRKPAQVTGNPRAREHRFTGVHAVAVTADGVDLAVVRDKPERVREWPRRKGVGGEATVHDRDGAATAFVAQIRKVLRQLHCREHALVHHGAAGQGREVDTLTFGTLAQRIDLPVEIDAAELLR
jgi:hypothetical protein